MATNGVNHYWSCQNFENTYGDPPHSPLVLNIKSGGPCLNTGSRAECPSGVASRHEQGALRCRQRAKDQKAEAGFSGRRASKYPRDDFVAMRLETAAMGAQYAPVPKSGFLRMLL